VEKGRAPHIDGSNGSKSCPAKEFRHLDKGKCGTLAATIRRGVTASFQAAVTTPFSYLSCSPAGRPRSRRKTRSGKGSSTLAIAPPRWSYSLTPFLRGLSIRRGTIGEGRGRNAEDNRHASVAVTVFIQVEMSNPPTTRHDEQPGFPVAGLALQKLQHLLRIGAGQPLGFSHGDSPGSATRGWRQGKGGERPHHRTPPTGLSKAVSITSKLQNL
jgi:hypothetical protein